MEPERICPVRADIDAKCHPKCKVAFTDYQKCIHRLENHTDHGGPHVPDCAAWFFDYQKCIDLCVCCSPFLSLLSNWNNIHTTPRWR